MSVKTYSNKPNAKRAALKVFENAEMFNLLQTEEGRWYFEEVVVVPAVSLEDESLIEEFGTANCPHCDVNLCNGVDSTDNMLADNNPQRVKYGKQMKLTFLCLGCGEEFGPEYTHVEPKTSTATGKGLKIQKDREERNGIKRPSVGGKCAAVWEYCESLYEANGMVPTPKALKGWAEENGHNLNNVSIELYRWRNFMGFKGR